MKSPIQVAFGITVYNQVHPLEHSLESILAQSFSEYGVVAVDDCSTDNTFEILTRYAAKNSRLRVFRNERRLGYTLNARRAYQLCTELFPSLQFFAWGSDHDVWHPQWLELLLDRLKAERKASLAYSWHHVIGANDDILYSRVLSAEGGMSGDRRERMIFALKDVPAGSLIYGLMRVSSLRQTPGLRLVLAPDSLLIAQLAAIGRLVCVPEFLWHRRYYGLFSLARQRRNSFPHGAPLHTYLPLTAQHSLALLHDFALRGTAAPALSSFEGLRAACNLIQAQRVVKQEEREKKRRQTARQSAAVKEVQSKLRQKQLKRAAKERKRRKAFGPLQRLQRGLAHLYRRVRG